MSGRLSVGSSHLRWYRQGLCHGCGRTVNKLTLPCHVLPRGLTSSLLGDAAASVRTIGDAY